MALQLMRGVRRQTDASQMTWTRPTLLSLLGALLLIAIGAQGLFNALKDFSSVETGPQRVMNSLQLAYGIVTPLPLWARWQGHRSTRPLLTLWGALLTVSVGLSPSAWGGASLLADGVTALVTALLALLVGWLLLRGMGAR